MKDDLTVNGSSSPRQFNASLWLIGIALLINAVVMAWPRSQDKNIFSGRPLQAALQIPALPDHGIYVMPARLGDKSWGMVLMDRRRRIFCVYRFLENASRLRLVAARDFHYDLLLHDYNNSSPTPTQVKAMVEQTMSPGQHAKNLKKGQPPHK